MKNKKKIKIRPIEREDPDLRLLARAIIELVMEEQRAEQRAREAAEAALADTTTTPSSPDLATIADKTTSRTKNGTEDDQRAA